MSGTKFLRGGGGLGPGCGSGGEGNGQEKAKGLLHQGKAAVPPSLPLHPPSFHSAALPRLGGGGLEQEGTQPTKSNSVPLGGLAVQPP